MIFKKLTLGYASKLFLLAFVLMLPLFSIEVCSGEEPLKYGLLAKRATDTKITRFAIFSERCSGTNYAHNLILRNYQIEYYPFGHKHFPPWFELPIEQYHGDPRHYTYEDTDHYLFVVMFRNSYDWVRSLHKMPWHADESLHNIPFEQFITSQWFLSTAADTTVNKQNIKLMEDNPLIDMNPKNGQPFRNVFKLRSAKIENMLQVQNKANNFYCIQYEVMRDHPEEVLEEIRSIFGLIQHETYQPIDYVKGVPKLGLYVPKAYRPISDSELLFINSQLDEDLENSIGYELTNHLEE